MESKQQKLKNRSKNNQNRYKDDLVNSLYWRLQCNKRILLLWCVSTKEGRSVRVKSATTRWREAKRHFSHTAVPLWTYCRLVLNTQWCLVSSQEDIKTAVLPSVVVVVVVVSLCCVCFEVVRSRRCRPRTGWDRWACFHWCCPSRVRWASPGASPQCPGPGG